MQAARLPCLDDTTRYGAGGGVNGSLDPLTKGPDENVHRVVGVLPHQANVIAVLGYIRGMGRDDATVFTKGMQCEGLDGNAADDSLIEGIRARVVKDVSIRGVPAQEPTVHWRHVGRRNDDLSIGISNSPSPVVGGNEQHRIGGVQWRKGGVLRHQTRVSAVPTGL